MRRRALLASLPTALCGCAAAPTGPSTDAYPVTQPNIFTAFDWDSDRSSLTIEFKRGNRLTPENTALLAVRTQTETETRTVWVASDDADTASEPVAEFPLVPGTELVHKMPEPSPTRLVWADPSRNRSRLVAYWEPEHKKNTVTSSGTAVPPSSESNGDR